MDNARAASLLRSIILLTAEVKVVLGDPSRELGEDELLDMAAGLDDMQDDLKSLIDMVGEAVRKI